MNNAQFWYGTAGADLGTPISHSLRFHSSANTFLSRTFATGSNVDKWTYAAWYKAFNIHHSGDPCLFSVRNDANNFARIELQQSNLDRLQFNQHMSGGTNTNLITTGRMNDSSAWYHVCIVYDSANSTANDRTKMYINGRRVTDLTTNTMPASGQNSIINNDNVHRIGTFDGSGTGHISGYVADVYFLDNVAVTDTNGDLDEFVRINNQGICVPKGYSGSYNINGFHLDFNPSNYDSANNRFTDQSPNSNHWTQNNFQTSSSHLEYFISKDSPTNNYAIIQEKGGHSGGASDPTVDLGGTHFTSFDANAKSLQTTFGVKSGEWYWEWVRNGTGSCHIGILDTNTGAYNSWLGNRHWAFASNMEVAIYHQGSTQGLATAIANGDTMGNALSFTDDTWKGWTNSTAWNSGNNLLHSSQRIQRDDSDKNPSPRRISPAFGHASHAPCYFLSGSHAGFTNGFDEPNNVPADHKTLCTENLAELAVTNPQDHFRCINYSGSSSDKTVTIGFKPDLVWLKSWQGFSTGVHGHIFDSLGGLTTRYYFTGDSATPGTSTKLKAVSNTTITLEANDGTVNDNGSKYYCLAWKAGGAPTATNNNTSGTMDNDSVSIDGELQTSFTPAGSPSIYPKKMSVNTEAKISIIQYTGNNVDGATVPHGLGVTPATIWVRRTDGAGDWRVYHHHEYSGKDSYARFNAIDASHPTDDSWNSTHPGANTVALGQIAEVNASGQEFTMVCMAEVEGFSSFGSYNTNQNAEGPFVCTMFEPAHTFGRQIDRGDHWWAWGNSNFNTTNPIVDASGGSYQLNTAVGNNLNLGICDVSANGFRWRAANGESNWTDGKALFWSWASKPFGGSNSAPNTAFFDSYNPEI